MKEEVVNITLNFFKNIPESGLLKSLIQGFSAITLLYVALYYLNYEIISINETSKKVKRLITKVLDFFESVLGLVFILIILVSIYVLFVKGLDDFATTFAFDFVIFIIALFIASLAEKSKLDTVSIYFKKAKTFFDAIFLIEAEKINDELKKRLNVSTELLEKNHELETLNSEIDKLRNDFNIESSLKYNGIFNKIGEEKLTNLENLSSESLNTFLLILRNLENLENRVTTEIIRLIKFSRQNLQIGTGLSLIAITFLFFSYNITAYTSLNYGKQGVIGLENYLTIYLPKFSIVILIEIIAFFFLKLYRNSILDIKKLQSEKTDIDFKIISLKLAIISKNEQNVTEIIKSSFSKSDSGNSKVVEDEIITSNQLSEIIKELLKKIK